MTPDQMRSLIGRLEAALKRPNMLAVPVDVGDVRAIIGWLRLELIATPEET